LLPFTAHLTATPSGTGSVDSFWKNRPTFVQPAHVARLGELKYDASGHRRKVIPKRDDLRREAKTAAQCSAEAAVTQRGCQSERGWCEGTGDAAGTEATPAGLPPKPALAACSEGAEQTLEHAATMLLFMQAVAPERIKETAPGEFSAGATTTLCSQ
jgi:hypothetical protein